MWDIQLSRYHVYVARLITSGTNPAETYRSSVQKRTAWTRQVEKGDGEKEKPLSEPEVSRRSRGGRQSRQDKAFNAHLEITRDFNS